MEARLREIEKGRDSQQQTYCASLWRVTLLATRCCSTSDIGMQQLTWFKILNNPVIKMYLHDTYGNNIKICSKFRWMKRDKLFQKIFKIDLSRTMYLYISDNNNFKMIITETWMNSQIILYRWEPCNKIHQISTNI